MAKEYRLMKGSIHEDFLNSKAKVQIFGGGFGNGKSSVAAVKTLQIARDYPGCNALMARSTYPKLNDTLRKTFLDFCPKEAISSFPMSKNSDNTCTLDNGSQINFRYLQQKTSAADGTSSSNLLSATYDLAVVDQIEDPEITHKDFLDLVGRMRGATLYRGDDPTMPRTGPRWIILTCNPTQNWVYHKLVKPYHEYLRTGVANDDLLCERDDEGRPIIVEGKPILLMELFEGPTTINAHALPADFISSLKNLYKGAMGKRYLDGDWGAYEGLIYPEYNIGTHGISSDDIKVYLEQDRGFYRPSHIGGYDYGLVSPSCYIHIVTDSMGNNFIVDGFYKPNYHYKEQAAHILQIQKKWGGDRCIIYADPAIFRKTAPGQSVSASGVVGESVATLLFQAENTLLMTRGNNDILNGITKVQSYLRSWKFHKHPITGEMNAPFLYYNKELDWIDQEFTSYFWKTNKSGEREETPVDGSDHFLDALKYALSHAPDPAKVNPRSINAFQTAISQWHESDAPAEKHARYKG